MKNFIQPGDTITLTAPYAVTAGAPFLVGSIFAIATAAAESGAAVEGLVTGVVEIAKTSAQAWATVGLLIYFDAATKLLTTAAAAGANKLVGVNVATAGNPSATGTVRLNGAFVL
jgi:predicted RecA/RadA family phage recombinase